MVAGPLNEMPPPCGASLPMKALASISKHERRGQKGRQAATREVGLVPLKQHLADPTARRQQHRATGLGGETAGDPQALDAEERREAVRAHTAATPHRAAHHAAIAQVHLTEAERLAAVRGRVDVEHPVELPGIDDGERGPRTEHARRPVEIEVARVVAVLVRAGAAERVRARRDQHHAAGAVGGVHGLAQRAVGVAGAVARVGGLGHVLARRRGHAERDRFAG
jgi:hypothetical protein